MPSEHVCRQCDETFETLSAKRLHQRDDCPGKYDEIDPDSDDAALQAATELLTCEQCEREHDGSVQRSEDVTEAGYSLEITFRCQFCGFNNVNTVILT